MAEKNFGIFTSLNWNSNKWQGPLTAEDLDNIKTSPVVENENISTCINFAHEKYVDEKGFHKGFIPQFYSKFPDKEKSKFVEVVFIKSMNWADRNNYIVGFYAFPYFERSKRISPDPEVDSEVEVNIKALAKDIHLLDNFINIAEDPLLSKIPVGKDNGKTGYNFLTKDHVFKVLDAISIQNPDDKKFKSLKFRLLTSIGRKFM